MNVKNFRVKYSREELFLNYFNLIPSQVGIGYKFVFQPKVRDAVQIAADLTPQVEIGKSLGLSKNEKESAVGKEIKNRKANDSVFNSFDFLQDREKKSKLETDEKLELQSKNSNPKSFEWIEKNGDVSFKESVKTSRANRLKIKEQLLLQMERQIVNYTRYLLQRPELLTDLVGNEKLFSSDLLAQLLAKKIVERNLSDYHLNQNIMGKAAVHDYYIQDDFLLSAVKDVLLEEESLLEKIKDVSQRKTKQTERFELIADEQVETKVDLNVSEFEIERQQLQSKQLGLTEEEKINFLEGRQRELNQNPLLQSGNEQRRSLIEDVQRLQSGNRLVDWQRNELASVSDSGLSFFNLVLSNGAETRNVSNLDLEFLQSNGKQMQLEEEAELNETFSEIDKRNNSFFLDSNTREFYSNGTKQVSSTESDISKGSDNVDLDTNSRNLHFKTETSQTNKNQNQLDIFSKAQQSEKVNKPAEVVKSADKLLEFIYYNIGINTKTSFMERGVDLPLWLKDFRIDIDYDRNKNVSNRKESFLDYQKEQNLSFYKDFQIDNIFPNRRVQMSNLKKTTSEFEKVVNYSYQEKKIDKLKGAADSISLFKALKLSSQKERNLELSQTIKFENEKEKNADLGQTSNLDKDGNMNLNLNQSFSFSSDDLDRIISLEKQEKLSGLEMKEIVSNLIKASTRLEAEGKETQTKETANIDKSNQTTKLKGNETAANSNRDYQIKQTAQQNLEKNYEAYLEKVGHKLALKKRFWMIQEGLEDVLINIPSEDWDYQLLFDYYQDTDFANYEKFTEIQPHYPLLIELFFDDGSIETLVYANEQQVVESEGEKYKVELVESTVRIYHSELSICVVKNGRDETIFGIGRDSIPDTHPFEASNLIGLREQEVDIAVIVDMINVFLLIWGKFFHAYSGLSGERGLEEILSKLYEWVSLEIYQKESKLHDYHRTYRWIRWEAERLFFYCRGGQDLLANYYIEKLLYRILNYLEDNHFNVVPIYERVDQLDKFEPFLSSEQRKFTTDKFRTIYNRIKEVVK